MKSKMFGVIILFSAMIYFAGTEKIQAQILKVNDEAVKPAKNELDIKRNHVKKENSPLSVFSEKKNKVKGVVRYDSPDKFAEFERMIRTRDGQSAPDYNTGYQQIELNKALMNQPLGKISPLNWTERGPGNVSGRTRGIVIDAADATHNTWFAGSVGGGIWKTTNAGTTWVNKTSNMPNLATTALAQSASNPSVLYCGTGEGFYNADAVNGGGIYKSTDAGNNWSLLANTAAPTFRNVNRIIVDPSTPNTLLAATNEGPAGIWRSTDGGTNWTRVFTGSNRVQDLRATPGNFSVQYAAVNSDGIYKSTDAGLTWAKASTSLPAGSRYEICVSPKNTQVLFANIEGASGSLMAYSNDAAATWSNVTVATGTLPDWFNGQGWYDNTIEAHPYNANSAIFGGVDLWRVDLTGSQSSTGEVLGVDLTNTNWIQWINWGGSYNDGSIGKSIDFYNWTFKLYEPTYSSTQLSSNYVTVEVLFGPGHSQKAHMFYRAATNLWQYNGYVTVPFEVWDRTNNRQLMVSFRDGNNNGMFDLNGWDNGGGTNGIYNCREYIMIHDKLYDSVNPSSEIAVDNGVVNKMLYAIWAELPVGGTWNQSSIPASSIKINWGNSITKYATFTPITDGYGQYTSTVPTPFVKHHVDQHSVVIVPINESTNSFWIVNGNDGGVSYSPNSGSTWSGDTEKNNGSNGGYNTTQFYGVDKKHGSDEYMAGAQDNGTWKSVGVSSGANATYTKTIGGDGFDVAWHYSDVNKIIGAYQYNGFYRTTNGGVTWLSAITGLADNGSGNGCFISKIAENNSDPDVIYTTGKSGVWKSEDFGATWNKTTISGWSFSGTSTPIAISVAQPQIVWAGNAISNSYSYLFVSQDGGLSFSRVPFLSQSMGSITGIDTHPTEPNTAFITFSMSGSGKIFKTTNLGQTWTDLTGFSGGTSTKGFPNVATYCTLVIPNTNTIWAGTEIGLVESTDGGSNWHLANNGLPAVCIWKMKIVDDQVVVATHGRGIFTVTLPELATYAPPAVTISPIITSAAQSFNGTVNVQVNLRSTYDSAKVFLNGVSSYKSINPAVGTATYSFTTGQSGTATVQVIGYKAGTAYKTVAKNINLLSFKPVQTTYVNNFNTATTDFSGDFTISKPAGFSTNNLQSIHPYTVNTTYTHMLLVPIRVATLNSFVEYDDIAIVEPGDAGAVFGDAEFWDYVVVEGSKDGTTWTPIAPGYDCNSNPKWLSAFNNSSIVPDSTYYVHHKIDLKSKFAAGDQILLRFRLFSDEALTGWGWAIDNLKIQEGAVGVEKEGNTLPKQFALMQNYPNPFNPSTSIKFQLPKAEYVKLEIYDSIGRLIETLVDNNLEAGYYNYKWNAKNYASGIYIYRITAGVLTTSRKMNLLK